MQEFIDLMASRNDFEKVIVKFGQKIEAPGVEFEVKFVHTMLEPYDLSHFNDSSTVYMMTADGTKTIFLGDIQDAACEAILKNNVDIKADIVQVSHHGFHGATVDLYKAIDAEVALFPVARKYYSMNEDRTPNKYLMEHSKEVYFEGDGTVELTMPYKKGSAKKFRQVFPM